jgi:hypothetical protein
LALDFDPYPILLQIWKSDPSFDVELFNLDVFWWLKNFDGLSIVPRCLYTPKEESSAIVAYHIAYVW